MSEIATFFRQRQDQKGDTHHFEIQTDKGPARFSVYRRGPVPLKAPKAEPHNKDWSSYFSKLQNALESCGGGLVVMLAGDSASPTLEVKPVGRHDDAPSHCWVLTPATPHQRLSIPETKRVPASSHVIVPIDDDAEKHLSAFLSMLPWVTPDFESLVLNAMRKPSLDSRLNHVEKQVFGKTAQNGQDDANAGLWKRWTAHAGRFLSKPATYAFGAAVLLILLLAANAYILHDLTSKLSAPATPNTVTKTKAAETTQDNNIGAQDASTPEPALVTATRQLIGEIKKSSNRDVQTLYADHFKEFDREDVTAAEVSTWFATQTPLRGKAVSRPLLWGIIKLQALKLDPRSKNLSFLQHWDDITDTKKFWSAIDPKEVDRDATGKRLAAAAACRLGYFNPPAPKLPKTDTPEPLVIADMDCDALNDADIAAGLTALSEYVKARK